MASGTFYRTLFERHPEPMWVYDGATLGFLAVNAAALDHYGYSRDEFLALHLPDLRSAEEAGALKATLDLLSDGRELDEQVRHRRADGTPIDVEVFSHPVPFDDCPAARAVSVRDVTKRLRVDRMLGERLAQQAAMAQLGVRARGARATLADLAQEAMPIVAATLAADLALVLHPRISGYEVIAAHGADLRPGEVLELADEALLERALAGEWSSGCLGGLDLASAAAVALSDPAGSHGVLVTGSCRQGAFSASDVAFLDMVATVLVQAADRCAAEAEIHHRALHDPLTGLPNRAWFFDRLGHALRHLRGDEGAAAAVLVLDLDGFKYLCDAYGHDAGDDLLVAVALRLREALRPRDAIARFGGDEFVVLCELEDPAQALEVAEAIAAAFTRPFELRDGEHFVTTSMGIAITSADGAFCSPQDLVRDADAAMYRAKERGRARYEVFDQSMRARALGRLRTENELRRALLSRRGAVSGAVGEPGQLLAGGELEVHYQPVVTLPSGDVQGFEALLRWRHPTRGLLGPGTFIPVAEETGAIVEIGRWVMREACAQAAGWAAARPDRPAPWVSVNLSMREVTEPRLADGIADALDEAGLDAGALVLEMTESVLLEHDASIEALERLASLGVRLALDDFGTGWSSLAYVKRFPLDVLKIDRRFVSELTNGSGDRSIVEAIVRMAEGLRLRVVAEGVETEEQRAELESLGCACAQGFLFGRPTPAVQIPGILGGAALGGARR